MLQLKLAAGSDVKRHTLAYDLTMLGATCRIVRTATELNVFMRKVGPSLVGQAEVRIWLAAPAL